MSKTDKIPSQESSPAEAKDQSTPAGQIQTVDQLRTAYPQLVKELIANQKETLSEFFANSSAAEIREHFPQLYQRIAAEVHKTSGPDLSIKGFLLKMGDPFAAGTLRTYGSLTKQTGLQVPYVLPYKDKHTKEALMGYIIRAEGGGDYERARLAREALAKCK